MRMRGRLAEIVEAHGRSIIKAVMDKHMIGAVDFKIGKSLRHVRVRVRAIRALQDEGFNLTQISRLMQMDYATIRYHTSKKRRVSQTADMARRYQESKAAVEARA